ncbi:copper chaperone PCu(A)C [Pelagibius litoralis]|uniref:Copper chaperone PCu(A)C n=1 Tax=Pelagibius litoralis TaxID=374515 RepID=A0A967K9Z6_9PROT|nr:copper chaperone PCu(A)C [Pelagibius litoralis]NIA70197.1 copper chaperone PCu(A)C [Pelagibius litoralis]
MKYRIAILPLVALAFGLMLSAVTPAQARDFTVGELKIETPWARATPGQAKNGAAYLMIHNAGAAGDRLIAAASDAAQRVELHSHTNVDGVMQMRQVEGVDVPAGGMATLKPGGYHVMLMGLKAPLREGDRFPVTLTFEKAGDVAVEVSVEAVGSMGAMPDDGMKKMDHGTMNHGETPKTN